jgi:hypothetical protein
MVGRIGIHRGRHRRIHGAVLLASGLMTGQQFTAALGTIGWSQRHLAHVLGCDTNLPTRWARGVLPIPDTLAVWLRRIEECVTSAGLPEWRKR